MTENESSVSTTSKVTDTADNSSSFEQEVSDILDGKTEEPAGDTKADTESGEVIEGSDEPKVSEEDTKDETTETPTPDENKQEKQEIKVPEKFKNPDGSVNVDNLLKAYLSAEPIFNQKAAWEKEKAQLLEKVKAAEELQKQQDEGAKIKGYDSYNDMQMAYQIANIEANEYAKYLHLTDNPEEVRQMLINYANNPSPALMKDIEVEFGSDVNKQVAAASERQRIIFEQQLEQQKKDNIDNSVRNTISESVEKHEDMFNIEPFKKLFVSSLQRYGENFTPEDSEILINSVIELREYFRNEYANELKAKKENEKATDTISSLAPVGGSANTASAKDIDSMTEDEFAKAIRRLL